MKFKYVVYHIEGREISTLRRFEFCWYNDDLLDFEEYHNNFNSEQEALEFIEEHAEALQWKMNAFTILREIVI